MSQNVVKAKSNPRRQKKNSKSSTNEEQPKRTSPQHLLPAPIDAPGRWLSRKTFIDSKIPCKGSFGAFHCRECKKIWISAYAQPIFRQGCQSCNQEIYPAFLWLNQHRSRSSDDGDKKVLQMNTKVPHDKARCEACRVGKCSIRAKPV
eukprot:TRINITY_DN1483_c0_g1_i1.p1 TRINITY_DN1483_c0_g1~~TRINITY_DN1483_c0_g1_i1.p1  ORF type:complete len:148 (+),score=18.41 TRINITY_DN1483_c0_g1_i1:149-592(+)